MIAATSSGGTDGRGAATGRADAKAAAAQPGLVTSSSPPPPARRRRGVATTARIKKGWRRRIHRAAETTTGTTTPAKRSVATITRTHTVIVCLGRRPTPTIAGTAPPRPPVDRRPGHPAASAILGTFRGDAGPPAFVVAQVGRRGLVGNRRVWTPGRPRPRSARAVGVGGPEPAPLARRSRSW